MAYRHNHDPYNTGQQQRHSPYQQQPQQNDYAIYAPPPLPVGNTGVTGDYSPRLPSEDSHTNWDAKSYQSSYTGSQAHLNPYEMAQVPPPVPQLQYQGYAQGPHPIQQPQQYPPRPGMYRDGGSTAGWSVIREKLMKRRSVKQVQLFRGNLVLDVPVPSNITPAGKGDIEEFSKIRYTAATCDPDDFMSSRYSLRQYLSGRDTELFIVMTMYNEDEVLFVKTMNAWVIFNFIKCRNSLALPRNSVIKNIGHLCGRTRSKTWGPEGWKKVVVCIVSDGRSKVNKRTLQVLSLVCNNSYFTIRSSSWWSLRWDATKKAFQKIQSEERMSPPIYSSSSIIFNGTITASTTFDFQVYYKCHCHRHGWSFNESLPRSDLVLPQGAEQEKVK